ncbi:hypothetical protein BRADI_3g42025v3 [Brachypodium distachyon]|uniref:Uncharacterized protein n=1 Tax=Brachypodium distachyon TaxID=15368 RepID=A0A2K2D2M7_BRADI|nr:hypothetical protein BRADI_3g42025v3 [Brachypodium distachyon]
MTTTTRRLQARLFHWIPRRCPLLLLRKKTFRPCLDWIGLLQVFFARSKSGTGILTNRATSSRLYNTCCAVLPLVLLL